LDEKETPVGVELIWLSSRLANHAYWAFIYFRIESRSRMRCSTGNDEAPGEQSPVSTDWFGDKQCAKGLVYFSIENTRKCDSRWMDNLFK
jgi:hypothetical protein